MIFESDNTIYVNLTPGHDAERLRAELAKYYTDITIEQTATLHIQVDTTDPHGYNMVMIILDEIANEG